MNQNEYLRTQIRDLLTRADAHLMFDEAVAGIPPNLHGVRHGSIAHTPWQLLEHLRITQWDIIWYSLKPDHVSPSWPDGHWPPRDTPPDARSWEQSVAGFRTDFEAFLGVIDDPSRDLLAPIPWGEGRTLLRQALVLGKHNSYHIGQLVQLKKALAGE